MQMMALTLRMAATDWQFQLVIAGSVMTGIAFWLWLPAGYSNAIAADPWLIFSFLLLYPLVEEWVFRGILQGELLKQEWGKRRGIGVSNANLLTSIVFVLLHFINHPPLWAVAVFVPSLALGHFRERHDSLVTPMLLHPFFNLTYLVAGIAPVT
jgi:membrane protease YdiL (CAAX protease family)